MKLEIDHLRTRIGRTTIAEDQVTPVPLRALAATLDRDEASAAVGEPIAPCWHGLYFLPVQRQSEIGSDGHPPRGGLLPPVPLPRRMWAGSRIEFLSPLRVGQAISRTSRIQDVRLKKGRSGPLVFVNVRHEIHGGGELAITDDHDDRRYVTTVEGYSGLVVHGPLIATLLLDLLRRELPDARVSGLSFKAVKPIFDGAPFDVCGRRDGDKTVKLWARTPEGHVAMDASATLA